MTGEELARRWLCGESDIDNRVLRNNLTLNQQERDSILATIAKWRNEELSNNIWSPFDANLAVIRGVAKEASASHELGLIIVDYLQLVAPENASIARHEQVATITRRLKNLAKELRCPILLLCQLNRQAEDGKRPNKSMLRESGAIEQDADRIILLHRNSERPNTVECIVDKNRHGPLTSCDLIFENGQFVDEPLRYSEFDAFNETEPELS